MKKIIFTSGNLLITPKKSGVENYHYEIFKEISKKIEYEVHLFNCTDEVKDENISKDSILINNKFKRSFSYIFPYSIFFKTTNGKKIYIVDGTPLRFLKGKKIGIVHDLMTREYPENYNIISRKIMHLYFNQLKKYDKVVVVSNETKNKLKNFYGIAEEKISVITPGVNREKISKIGNKKLQKINEITLPDNFILHLGAFRKNKRVDLLVKMFKEFKEDDRSNIKLILAGGKSGEYYKIRKMVEDLSLEKDVIFLGFVSEDEKYFLLKNCKAFVSLSSDEGFGIPVIEAMSSGALCLLSNINVYKEIAKDSAVYWDKDSEVSVLKLMLEDVELRNELLKKSRMRVENFTWKKSGERFLKILKEL